MTVTDNKTGMPLEHYCAEFAKSDPLRLAERGGFILKDNTFEFALLSHRVGVTWPDMDAVDLSGGKALSPAVRILLGRLLLEGALIPGSGHFMAYSEFPWGSVYNAQFTARCIRRMAASYGKNTEKFADACEKLGGKRISGADAAYELEFLPGLLIRLYLWEGDDEFPASGQILFSDNFAAAFTAEDMAVIGDTVLNALKGRM